MSIRTTTPPSVGVLSENPNIPLQEQERYEALIFNKGYSVKIENGVECPCKGKSGAPLTTCHNCLGLGWIFINPLYTKAIITSANSSTKYKHWSRELAGTVNITVKNSERLAFMDKVTFGGKTNILSEVKPVITSGANKFIFCSYQVELINNVYIFDNDTSKLIVVPADEYTINSGNSMIVDLNVTTYPTQFNGVVSIEYDYLESYNVIDIPHSFRTAFIDDSNGKRQEFDLPVQAIAGKSHFIMGKPTNYASNNLIDNSYL